MELIYKIFDVSFIGGNKGKGGLFGNRLPQENNLCYLFYIKHIKTHQIRGSNIYNKNIIKQKKSKVFNNEAIK